MSILPPSNKERAAIQARANAGDKSAKNYLELLDACIQVLQGSNGISLARGLVGEHNDVYGSAIDDALSELMPTIFKVAAAGWESLKFYVPEEMQREAAQALPPVEINEEQMATGLIEVWARLHFKAYDAEAISVSREGSDWLVELQGTGQPSNPVVTFAVREDTTLSIKYVNYPDQTKTAKPLRFDEEIEPDEEVDENEG